jgi:hypothetical protein
MNSTFSDSQYYFNITSGIILLIFGIAGNLMVIVVFMSKKLRNHSMNRYLSALAISDSIELIISVGFNISPYMGFSHMSILCKISAGLMIMFFQYCSIITMIVSIDRFISVIYAKRFTFKNSFQFQLKVLFTALMATLPISVVFSLFHTSIEKSGQVAYCDFNDLNAAFFITSLNYVLSTFIPFIVMVACTLALFRKVKKLRTKITRRYSSFKRKDVKKEVHLLKTMIGIDFFFFICNTPICIYVILIGYFPDLNDFFIFNILNFISVFHNTFSFVVYFICNKVFRQKFLNILLSLRNVDFHSTTLDF